MKKINNVVISCLAIIIVLIIFIILSISNGLIRITTPEEDIQLSKLGKLASKLDIIEISGTEEDVSEDIKQIVLQENTYNNLDGKTIQFIIDTSASMDEEKIKALQDALYKIMGNIPSSANVELITFNSEINVYKNLGSFSQDTKLYFANYINSLNGSGNSCTFDALIYALNANIDNENCNIIFICDGPVNTGYTYNDVKDKIIYTEIPIYTVAYEQDLETEILQEISKNSNGIFQEADKDNIYEILEKIFKEI